jgi:hypothetical protein
MGIKKVLPSVQIVTKPTINKQHLKLDLKLPDKPKDKDMDIKHRTILLYGREKIGKTTFFSTFPEALFFCTEPGAKGLEIFEFNSEGGGVHNWDVFRCGVSLLEQNPNKFKTVIVDTADRAYDMCLDWCCNNLGIDYPGTDASGEADYGKSWKEVRKEFMLQIDKIIRTGRGLCFTSHVKEEEVKPRYGTSYTHIYPSMGKQARQTIEALVDIIIYAEFVRDSEGDVNRVLITQGNETIWAGSRDPLPTILPLQKVNGYDVLEKAFKGQYDGIDISKLYPSHKSGLTLTEYLKTVELKAKRESGKEKV